MKNPKYLEDLELILYHLYHIDNIDSDDRLFHDLARYYEQYHSGQEIAHFIEALEWAVQSKDTDFREFKVIKGIHFTNAEIVLFLQGLLSQLKLEFDTENLASLQVPQDDRNLKILIVEDRVAQYGMLGSNFDHTSYELLSINTYNAALRKVLAEKFDIILSSLQINIEDNLKLLESVRATEKQESLSRIPIIILLANNDESFIQQLIQAGCDSWFILPIVRAKLLQEVYRLSQ